MGSVDLLLTEPIVTSVSVSRESSPYLSALFVSRWLVEDGRRTVTAPFLTPPPSLSFPRPSC